MSYEAVGSSFFRDPMATFRGMTLALKEQEVLGGGFPSGTTSGGAAGTTGTTSGSTSSDWMTQTGETVKKGADILQPFVDLGKAIFGGGQPQPGPYVQTGGGRSWLVPALAIGGTAALILLLRKRRQK